ncbi:cytochrome P450 [Rhizopogon vinicolor AM-OR11-026]|uniref:Cytochrome P450 n=1 Tax=Rhizopogon vinicolor AM-OR11-026 TaxID=1314800 RepID=A0A1B7MKS5_9AGAM|nr:cytochrome P450 [Rhizopogon vinicolor AM-OR11-026]
MSMFDSLGDRRCLVQLLESRHTPCETHVNKSGPDIIPDAPFWPNTIGNLWIADAQTIRESRGRFLSSFRKNIVVSEGDEWKHYREIVAPIMMFSDRNDRLIWDATTQVMLELLDTVWEGKDEVLALFAIGAAGFGRPISWKEDSVIPSGHQMTFRDALHATLQGIILKVLLPTWAMGFTKGFRHGIQDLHSMSCRSRYRTEMIQERKGSRCKEDDHDLLSRLLAANDDENLSEGEVKLSDSELIGSYDLRLYCGRITTAHSLAFALALLALYSDKQEELYQHIKRVLPDGRIPTYDDMPSLGYCSAPSVENTTFTITDVDGMKRTVTVPQEIVLTLDIIGLHYNPGYWEDPYTFKPERFLGDWNRDAFLPFSADAQINEGYRACVGRKFSETEAAADEPQFAGESYEQREVRILDARSVLTPAPTHIPLVFKQRS